MIDQRYYNTADAAKYLGISVISLHRYVKQGKITASRPGGKSMLFDVKELDAFIVRHRGR